MKLKAEIEFKTFYFTVYIDNKPLKIYYNDLILTQLNEVEEFLNYIRNEKP